MQHLGLRIDTGRDALLSEQSLRLLKDYYCREDETSPQQAFARAAVAYSYGDLELAQRIYDYASKGWFMFSSPVLSNAPIEGEDVKALPISCFLTFVPDTLEGLIDHTSELRWLSVKGGGVGGHWSDVRAVSNKAPGPMPFLHTVDADMVAYRQGRTRKGSYAAYIDVDHPDIVEFVHMRVPTGDVNRKNLNLHHAVNITDKFMEAVETDADWDLIDPASKEVRETLKARKLWELLLETRYRTGEPYLNFIDTANRALPESQKVMGLKIRGSNLCLVGDTSVDVIFDGEIVYDMPIEKVIELLKEGNDLEVKGYGETGVEYDVITDGSLMGYTDELYEITDESTGKTIRCTADHKIYTRNRGYVMAKDLDENDELLSVFGKNDRGIKIEKMELDKPVPVYDITTEKNKNFFANDILVHNCNEIHLVTNEERSAVCCLSSVNVEMYDEWKETRMIEDLIVFLDNVLQFFIDHAGDEISRARYSAERERSLGLGAMGFHSYLQKHRIAFESEEAANANEEIFKIMYEKALTSTLELGKERGEAPDMEGTGRRNAHMLAIAPNANSSMIAGTSPSIEPWKANAFTSRTRVGSHLNRNKYLEEELEKLGRNTPDIWSSIITNGGSVQHLDFLDDHTKNVFKTAIELDQMWLIRLAGDRQNYLCQGQSLNIFFPAGASKARLHKVHYEAWKQGCKGLYYLRTETSNRVENVSQKIEREKLDNIVKAENINFLNGDEEDQDSCVACQG